MNFVLTCEEMAYVMENPYKLQFYPNLKDQIESAQMHSIPILDVSFLDKCLAAKAVVPYAQFKIKQLEVDAESKWRINREVPSDLDPRVQEVVKEFFDQKELDRSIVEMGLDVRKIKLVTQQKITDGYTLLKEIESRLQPQAGETKAQHEEALKRLATRFYDLIPHNVEGGKEPPVIKTIEQIKDKSALLGALTDVEIAQRLIAQGAKDGLNMNPIDVNYRKLRATIAPLESYRAEYNLIEQMVRNTQSGEFKWNVDIVNVFEVEREGEPQRFQPFKKLPHHRLLWHGSRTPNYIGIISQGLRIAPPEAPVTGYFLGKGIYFADQVAVSSQYCHAKPESPHGYLMICDVALGRSFQIAHGKFISKEDLDEAGFHSVKCCGTKAPHSGYDITTPDGLIVSLGKESKSGVPVSELIHNEIVVYAPEQVLIRYLIKLKFTFPDKAAAN